MLAKDAAGPQLVRSKRAAKLRKIPTKAMLEYKPIHHAQILATLNLDANVWQKCGRRHCANYQQSKILEILVAEEGFTDKLFAVMPNQSFWNAFLKVKHTLFRMR